MKLYVGMDLHSTNCYTVVLDDQSHKVFSRKLPNDREQILAALLPYKERCIKAANALRMSIHLCSARRVPELEILEDPISAGVTKRPAFSDQ